MISRQLTACLQRGVDSNTGIWSDRSVAEYYGAYSAIIALFPMSVDFPIDICANFIINFSSAIGDQMTDTQWIEPVKPIGESNAEGLQRLRSIKDAALVFESSLRSFQRLQDRSNNRNSYNNRGATHNPSTGPRTGGRNANSFTLSGNQNGYNGTVAYAGTNTTAFTFQHVNEQRRDDPRYDQRQDFGGNNCGDNGHGDYANDTNGFPYSGIDGGSGQYIPPTSYPQPASEFPLVLDATNHTYEQCMMTVAIYSSLAEEALTKAQGPQVRPLLECWGCKDLPRYHDQRHTHRFFQCPNKTDPAVQANGMRGYHEFIERKRSGTGTPYGPTRVMSALPEWKADGYPSHGFAELIQDIARESTPASARRAFCGTFKAKHVPSGERKRGPQIDIKGPSDRSPYGFPVIVPDASVAACIHYSNTVRDNRPEANVQISQLLPHSNFPIGEEGEATLLCMIDTGASLNLGRFSYHEDIFLTNPDLVHSFVYLKDIDGMKPLNIGGVGTEGPPAEVVAVTTYKTDLFLNGKMVLLSIALSPTAAANTIVGLPLLKAFNSTILLGSDTLVCQKVGAAFALSYVTPLRSDAAPTVCKEASRSFYTPTHTEMDATTTAYQTICTKTQAMTITTPFALIADDEEKSLPDAQPAFDPWAEWYSDSGDENSITDDNADDPIDSDSPLTPEQK